MAKWVLARCVYVKKGGMVTRGLSNTIDYLTAANTNLETKFREANHTIYPAIN